MCGSNLMTRIHGPVIPAGLFPCRENERGTLWLNMFVRGGSATF